MVVRVNPKRRFGFTIIELLVVLGIMALLIASAIPLIRPQIKDRKLREASRQLNAFFAGAKARAAEHGRHVALWFERDPNFPNRCLDVYMADVPPAYAGDVSGARAVVRFNPALAAALGDTLKWQLDFAYSPSQNAANTTLVDTYSLVRVGESFLIRFDNQGPQYACTRIEAGMPNVASDDLFAISIPPEPGPYPPPYPNYPAMFPVLERYPKGMPPSGCWHPGLDGGWGVNNPMQPFGVNDDDGDLVLGNVREAGMGNADLAIGLPYQIFRKPMKNSRGSLQMPNGTAIDLGFSGVSATGKQFDAFPPLGSASLTPTTLPVIVSVSPTGLVDRAYLANDGNYLTVEGTVHFLIGHNDLMSVGNLPDPSVAIPAVALPALTVSLRNSNLGDMSCYWISMGNRTGVVTTAENADFVVPIPLISLGDFLANARQITRSTQSKGGG